ncbi:MAG: penicillin-binding transpeptidase domain-containing protein, partial [Mucinivorans sp.]
IVDGMYRAVHEGGGTAQGARIDGFDVCGKTGTAQNGQGANHSTFMCFAPRDNPRIAVSVYVEHGGYGASMAVPIASMIVEEYLTDTIKREDLRKRIGETEIYYPMYREKVVKK